MHELFAPGPIAVDDDEMVEVSEIIELSKRSIPKKKKQKKSKEPKKSAKRPSVNDSKNSTIIFRQSDNAKTLQGEVKKVADSQRKKKLLFHPIIVVNGADDEEPTSFYVFVNHIYLRHTSFNHILNAYLQSFEVFDLHYPKEGARVCKFLQELCFNIDSKDPVVKTFMKDLEATLEN